jgi:type IX secretion system PorP/SprF family membrane protein
MKRIIALFVLIILGSRLIAQQEYQVTHNMFNKLPVNPGYAGISNAICANLIVHQQWNGFKDDEGNKVAPQTNIVSVDGKVNLLRGGIGLSVIQDQLGFYKNTNLELDYSYHMDLSEGQLGLGVQIGFYNNTLDFSKFLPVDAGDPLLNGISSTEKNMMVELGLGAFYYQDNAYLGASTARLIQNKKSIASTTNSDTYINFKRHYFFTGGYKIELPNYPMFEINPSFFTKSDFAATQLDINTLVKYNNKFWGGISYRGNFTGKNIINGVAFMAGVKIREIHVGYAYDLSIKSIKKGGHEIVAGYCFNLNIEKSPEGYKNVRFL